MASLCLSELLDGILDVVVFEAMHGLLTIQLFLVGDLEIQQTMDDHGFFPSKVGRICSMDNVDLAVVFADENRDLAHPDFFRLRAILLVLEELGQCL